MTGAVRRVHIFGASGSGTSTLGRALAETRGFHFIDTDDSFWKVKYSEIHPVADRIRLIEQAMLDHGRWVLSGSLCGWGDGFIPSFDLAIFVTLPPEIRMARLAERERQRYGDRILPEGSHHAQYVALMAWAAQYDTGGAEVRSRSGHEAWIQKLPCPVLRLEGDLGVDAKLRRYEEFLTTLGQGDE